MKKLILTLIIFSSGLFAQKHTLTLEESLKIGLENSSEIMIAESKLKGAKEKVKEIDSQMYPRLSYGMGYTNISVTKPDKLSFTPTSSIAVQNPFYSYGLNFTLQAPIFVGFQLSSLSSAAELNSKAVEHELQNTINQKALQIHTAFWNLYKAGKSVELVNQYLDVLKQKLKDTEGFLENGLVTKNDLLKLKVQVSNAKLRLVDIKNKKEVAMALLNQVLGYPLEEQTDIKVSGVQAHIEKFQYNKLKTEALKLRNEVQSLNYKIDAGRYNITAANSGWFPKLYAVGNFNYYKLNAKTFSVSNETLQFWYIGLSLNWDLWDWGHTSSKTSQAEQELIQAMETKELLTQQIELEIYNNFLSLESEEQKVEIGKLAVESAEENYRITADKYQNQLASSTDLITAQSELLDAKIQLEISIADYNLAITKLEIAAGRRVY